MHHFTTFYIRLVLTTSHFISRSFCKMLLNCLKIFSFTFRSLCFEDRLHFSKTKPTKIKDVSLVLFAECCTVIKLQCWIWCSPNRRSPSIMFDYFWESSKDAPIPWSIVWITAINHRKYLPNVIGYQNSISAMPLLA